MLIKDVDFDNTRTFICSAKNGLNRKGVQQEIVVHVKGEVVVFHHHHNLHHHQSRTQSIMVPRLLCPSLSLRTDLVWVQDCSTIIFTIITTPLSLPSHYHHYYLIVITTIIIMNIIVFTIIFVTPLSLPSYHHHHHRYTITMIITSYLFLAPQSLRQRCGQPLVSLLSQFW